VKPHELYVPDERAEISDDRFFISPALTIVQLADLKLLPGTGDRFIATTSLEYANTTELRVLDREPKIKVVFADLMDLAYRIQSSEHVLSGSLTYRTKSTGQIGKLIASLDRIEHFKAEIMPVYPKEPTGVYFPGRQPVSRRTTKRKEVER
jgi:hypothetical protein